MKNKLTLLTALLLAVCLMLSLAACGNSEPDVPAVSAGDVFNALLEKAAYDTPLTDNSSSAALTYADLPANAVISMYTGNAQ